MASDPYEYAKRIAQACSAGKGCLIVGTNHFVSTQAAIAHYQGAGGQAWAIVKAKLASGEIRIGEPALEPGQCLVLLDGRRRYGIKIT